MSEIGKKLRSLEGGSVMFRCPGCNENHVVHIAQHPGGHSHPIWGFNGNGDVPTFTPSVLVRTGHHVPGWDVRFPPGADKSCWCTYNAEHSNDPAPFECFVCHSFVTDGQIQFLTDCTHALAGKTVELPDFD
jgi:hypothetical protein